MAQHQKFRKLASMLFVLFALMNWSPFLSIRKNPIFSNDPFGSCLVQASPMEPMSRAVSNMRQVDCERLNGSNEVRQMCRYLLAAQQQQRQLESLSPMQLTTTRRFTFPNIDKRYESDLFLTPDTMKRIDNNINEGSTLFASRPNTIAARSLRSAGSPEMMGLLAGGGEAFGGPDGVWNDEMGMSRWQPMRGKRQQQK